MHFRIIFHHVHHQPPETNKNPAKHSTSESYGASYHFRPQAPVSKPNQTENTSPATPSAQGTDSLIPARHLRCPSGRALEATGPGHRPRSRCLGTPKNGSGWRREVLQKLLKSHKMCPKAPLNAPKPPVFPGAPNNARGLDLRSPRAWAGCRSSARPFFRNSFVGDFGKTPGKNVKKRRQRPLLSIFFR